VPRAEPRGGGRAGRAALPPEGRSAGPGPGVARGSAGAAPATVRDLRRGQIVAAARALVAEGGLEGLTVGALEARLGYTRGVITYHFRDKDEIVEAVLESAIAEIDAGTTAEVRARAGFDEKVEAVLRSKVRGFLDHPEASDILLSFWGRLRSDERARERNARLFARYREEGRVLLAEGRRRGLIRDVPEREVAALLVGTVIGVVVQALFAPDAIDPERAVREAGRSFAARLLAGA
jgi:AcrR family transcriptional regulator